MNKPVIVLGGGGHASVLVDILQQLDHSIIGLVASARPLVESIFGNIPYYALDDDVLNFEPSKVLLVNGIGSLPGNETRHSLHKRFKQAGYEFMTVVSPQAIVSKHVRLSAGVQVMPGAIINANSDIGQGTIVNTGAIIDHDCTIGNYNHIATRASLSGGVVTGENVHIGAGANIIQSITIGNDVMVGAGSTVLANLHDNSKHYVAKSHVC